MPLALAAMAGGALVPGTTAAAAPRGCQTPEVVGVNLTMARQVLSASGCQVLVRQLSGHGRYVTPSSPQGQQLVGRQSPGAGRRSAAVTIWLKPLCSQSAAPGPAEPGPAVTKGGTELISGLFLSGGPLVRSVQCRSGVPSAGTITIASPDGRVIVSRSVGDGRLAIFPLPPGRYEVEGSFAEARSNGAPLRATPVPVTITAQRTTRLNLVGQIR
ncbi:MAG: hypothetical protein ACLQBB_04320 [Solirubrobacteraceae bacterium]